MISLSRETLADIDANILILDGFDDAIIGYIERAGANPIACYDKDKCIEILSKDMTYEDAIEYFYFNTIGSYMGDYTPCFFTSIERANDENSI